MKIFTTAQLQEAQDWRPQLERFVMADAIYVVETERDYQLLNDEVKAVIAMLNQW